jgi:hypothetical protein
LVTVEMVKVAAVLLATAQLKKRGKVTTWPLGEVLIVPQLPVNPVPKSILTALERANPASNVTVMESPPVAEILPNAEVVKPIVHCEAALAEVEPGVKVTPETELAADATPWPMNDAAIPPTTTSGRKSRSNRRANHLFLDRVPRSMSSPLSSADSPWEWLSHIPCTPCPAHSTRNGRADSR